jgi:hypothetical protein
MATIKERTIESLLNNGWRENGSTHFIKDISNADGDIRLIGTFPPNLAIFKVHASKGIVSIDILVSVSKPDFIDNLNKAEGDMKRIMYHV